MQVGLTTSSALHAGVLALALVSFSGAREFPPVTETVPVDVVSATDLSKMMRGSKSAPKADKPKQVAEKVDPTPTPIEDPKLKVSDKPPVEATAPPPPPPPAPPQPKVEDKPPVPKAAEAPPKAEPKVDEALKAEPKKEEPKKDEAPKEQAKAAPLPPRKPAIPKEPPKPVDSQQPQREFSTDELKQLLDKRTPQRQAAAAPTPSSTGALGSQSGNSATLSASIIDALMSRIKSCWHPPGIPFDQSVAVTVRFTLGKDGAVTGRPRITGAEPSTSPYAQAYGESGIRAIAACAPYTFLPVAQYDLWSEIDFRFPSDDGRQLTARR